MRKHTDTRVNVIHFLINFCKTLGVKRPWDRFENIALPQYGIACLEIKAIMRFELRYNVYPINKN